MPPKDDGPKWTRWLDVHTKGLGKMFDKGMADPQQQSNSKIDEIWEEFYDDEDSIYFGCPNQHLGNISKKKLLCG